MGAPLETLNFHRLSLERGEYSKVNALPWPFWGGGGVTTDVYPFYCSKYVQRNETNL